VFYQAAAAPSAETRQTDAAQEPQPATATTTATVATLLRGSAHARTIRLALRHAARLLGGATAPATGEWIDAFSEFFD
jgi:hypothetical protein